MQEIKFLVQGSANEPYETSFFKDGEKLSAFCTCPAGTFGRPLFLATTGVDRITDSRTNRKTDTSA